MKSLAIRNGFGLENLAVVDLPDPVPGPGQVVLRVRAASLNYRDLLIAKGMYNPALPMPRVLGSDGAGVVESVGEGVTRWKAGDEAVACFFQNWNDGMIPEVGARRTLGGERDGVLAEKVLLEEEGLLPLPKGMSFEQAATLPCAALTAWNALMAGGCSKDTTVLIQGTGGVSLFALQLAKAMGATVFGISSSDEKLARAVHLGLDAGTNYKLNPDWDKWVRKETNGAGVDIAVEVGGAGTLERTSKCVKSGGFIGLIGVLAGAGAFNPINILMKAIDLQGIFVGSRVMMESMIAFMTANRIEPVLDRIFPLAEGLAAIKHLESGSHFGKIVVAI